MENIRNGNLDTQAKRAESFERSLKACMAMIAVSPFEKESMEANTQ